jgi:hypothetical protein
MAVAESLHEVTGAWLPGVGSMPEPTPVPSEQVRIVFEGEGSGIAELAWGQRDIWNAMVAENNVLPMGGYKALDPGTTVEDVADELAYLLNRFPSMRTRLRFDGEGRPRQELSSSGETVLEVFDAETYPAEGGEDAADVLASAVEALYRHVPYDLRTDWPVRMAVVRRSGAPTHMVVIMHHLTTDGGGAAVMLRDVAVRATAPPTGMQMLEQARWQGSPEGRRQSDKVMRYMEPILREMPAEFHPAGLGDSQQPPHWEGQYDSAALRIALPALAARSGATENPVMTALWAIALARITGVSPVLIRPVVGNRFRRALADVVCHTAQTGLLTLDVVDTTVAEVVERARQAGLATLKNGYYDPESFSSLVARVGEERGAELNISTIYNDLRADRPVGDTAPVPTADELEAARAASTFGWSRKLQHSIVRLFLTVDETPGAVRLLITADTAHLSPAVIEELSRGIEAVAVEAVLDPGATTGVKGLIAGPL